MALSLPELLVEEPSFETMHLNLLVVQGVQVFQVRHEIQILPVRPFLQGILVLPVLLVSPLVLAMVLQDIQQPHGECPVVDQVLLVVQSILAVMLHRPRHKWGNIFLVVCTFEFCILRLDILQYHKLCSQARICKTYRRLDSILLRYHRILRRIRKLYHRILRCNPELWQIQPRPRVPIESYPTGSSC